MAETKTSLICDFIDNSKGFYLNNVPLEHRSLTAIPFFLRGGAALEAQYIEKAAEKGYCKSLDTRLLVVCVLRCTTPLPWFGLLGNCSIKFHENADSSCPLTGL